MCRTCITSSPPTCQYPSEKAHTVQRAQTVVSRVLQPSPIKQPGLSPCLTIHTHTCLCGFRGGESHPSKLLVFTRTVCALRCVCLLCGFFFFFKVVNELRFGLDQMGGVGVGAIPGNSGCGRLSWSSARWLTPCCSWPLVWTVNL